LGEEGNAADGPVIIPHDDKTLITGRNNRPDDCSGESRSSEAYPQHPFADTRVPQREPEEGPVRGLTLAQHTRKVAAAGTAGHRIKFTTLKLQVGRAFIVRGDARPNFFPVTFVKGKSSDRIFTTVASFRRK